ncbi:hypothetical protein MPSEU_000430400 [Mayamaea pseudoterrestris]|nr:hypothetical protein MPSEU_000430400 [Mayamaea pseudoterrestris]
MSSTFSSILSNISASHNRFKHAVHTQFRIPIQSKYGRWAMGFVYMTIPIVGGYYVMQWAIGKSHESIGERGELLPVKTVQGIGNMRIASDGSVRTIRTGVHLSVSSEEEQRRNRKKLERFLQHTLKQPNETPKDQDA